MTLFDERPIRPMMAKTGDAFDSNDYFFELKWDGLRALLFKSYNRIELQNRNLRDVTAWYPELKLLGQSIKAKTAIVDGEVVIFDKKGLPNFGQMQNRFGITDPKESEVLGKTMPVTYVAFDLLHLNGKDLLTETLESRKAQLKKIVEEGPHLLFGDYVEKNGKKFYDGAAKKGFEGILAKKRDSQYLPGVRDDSWVKVKTVKTLDCVIAGFTRGEGARAPSFGALIVGAYDSKGRLQHLGNVGGGFNNRDLDTLTPRLHNLVKKIPTIEGPVEAPSPITWVKPRIVLEAKYTSLTHEGKLRFPRFSRLRADKAPEDCLLDF